MKKDFGDKTHNATDAAKAQQFRAQATGIGQTCSASRVTGGMRAQRVSDAMPPAQRAALPETSGYPPATPMEMLVGMSRKGY